MTFYRKYVQDETNPADDNYVDLQIQGNAGLAKWPDIKGFLMKKLVIITALCSTMIIVTVMSGFAGGFGDFKKAACERTCDEAFNKCMEAAGKVVDREGQGSYEGDIKYEAKKAACEEKLDECKGKCN